MTLRKATSRPALAALAVLCLGATSRAESVDDVLARMDTAAKQFHSYSANVKQVRYGDILRTYDNSSGAVQMKRAKNGIQGIFDETAGPDHTVFYLEGNIAEKYLPKANTAERYKTKQYAATIDQILLLGFAITRDEINRDYNSKLAGSEQVNGVMTSHVVLTPKSAHAQETLKAVDLWIDSNGHALRVKFTEPDRNYRQLTFSDLQVNPSLPDSAFELKLPPDTKIINVN